MCLSDTLLCLHSQHKNHVYQYNQTVAPESQFYFPEVRNKEELTLVCSQSLLPRPDI